MVEIKYKLGEWVYFNNALLQIVAIVRYNDEIHYILGYKTWNTNPSSWAMPELSFSEYYRNRSNSLIVLRELPLDSIPYKYFFGVRQCDLINEFEKVVLRIKEELVT